MELYTDGDGTPGPPVQLQKEYRFFALTQSCIPCYIRRCGAESVEELDVIIVRLGVHVLDGQLHMGCRAGENPGAVEVIRISCRVAGCRELQVN